MILPSPLEARVMKIILGLQGANVIKPITKQQIRAIATDLKATSVQSALTRLRERQLVERKNTGDRKKNNWSGWIITIEGNKSLKAYEDEANTREIPPGGWRQGDPWIQGETKSTI